MLEDLASSERSLERSTVCNSAREKAVLGCVAVHLLEETGPVEFAGSIWTMKNMMMFVRCCGDQIRGASGLGGDGGGRRS